MVVSSRGRRFGSSDRLVRVRDPIVLQPTFPRFLSLGEPFEIPVSVRNDTGKDASSRSRSRSRPDRAAAGKERPIEVPNGAERLVYFPARSGENGGDAHVE